MEGLYGIHKEKGPTSHDVVNTLRRITGIRKIGHAGTLDPLASGVLIIGIGRASTKQLDQIVKFEKEYEATIHLGESSTTDDAEGEKTPKPLAIPPTKAAVSKILKTMVGEHVQMPPTYSALKIKGKAAYRIAREGKKPELKPRTVFIKSITLKKYHWPSASIEVVCGPGTYIRAIARDLGAQLGTGGYLTDLVRTRIGSYKLKNTLTLKEFAAKAQKHAE
jgi:tRNA pseudouridine55 synthase